MLRETRAGGKRKGPRRVRFAGIGKDAEALGVHRIHLYLVLTGQRSSRSLLGRYYQLKDSR